MKAIIKPNQNVNIVKRFQKIHGLNFSIILGLRKILGARTSVSNYVFDCQSYIVSKAMIKSNQNVNITKRFQKLHALNFSFILDRRKKLDKIVPKEELNKMF